MEQKNGVTCGNGKQRIAGVFQSPMGGSQEDQYKRIDRVGGESNRGDLGRAPDTSAEMRLLWILLSLGLSHRVLTQAVPGLTEPKSAGVSGLEETVDGISVAELDESPSLSVSTGFEEIPTAQQEEEQSNDTAKVAPAGTTAGEQPPQSPVTAAVPNQPPPPSEPAIGGAPVEAKEVKVVTTGAPDIKSTSTVGGSSETKPSSTIGAPEAKVTPAVAPNQPPPPATIGEAKPVVNGTTVAAAQVSTTAKPTPAAPKVPPPTAGAPLPPTAAQPKTNETRLAANGTIAGGPPASSTSDSEAEQKSLPSIVRSPRVTILGYTGKPVRTFNLTEKQILYQLRVFWLEPENWRDRGFRPPNRLYDLFCWLSNDGVWIHDLLRQNFSAAIFTHSQWLSFPEAEELPKANLTVDCGLRAINSGNKPSDWSFGEPAEIHESPVFLRGFDNVNVKGWTPEEVTHLLKTGTEIRRRDSPLPQPNGLKTRSC